MATTTTTTTMSASSAAASRHRASRASRVRAVVPRVGENSRRRRRPSPRVKTRAYDDDDALDDARGDRAYERGASSSRVARGDRMREAGRREGSYARAPNTSMMACSSVVPARYESGGVSAENLNDIPSQLLQAHAPNADRVVPCACWALRLP